MIELLNQATNVSYTRHPVLIVGESGSGRRLLAEFLHDKSSSESALLRFNHLVMPSLKDIKSSVTILVEDIDQLDFIRQEKLVSIINHTHSSERPVFWIATGSDQIVEKWKTGHLRRDLYDFFKLQILRTIPLRERREDIIFLAEKNLEAWSQIYGQKVFSETLKADLLDHTWPGNVKELEEKCTQAVLSSSHAMIQTMEGLNDERVSQALQGIQTLAEMERQLIFQTLNITQNNKSQAARLLGISIRTLRNKLSLYREDVHESAT